MKFFCFSRLIFAFLLNSNRSRDKREIITGKYPRKEYDLPTSFDAAIAKASPRCKGNMEYISELQFYIPGVHFIMHS